MNSFTKYIRKVTEYKEESDFYPWDNMEVKFSKDVRNNDSSDSSNEQGAKEEDQKV